ncbi:dihydroxy-acid dehydratase ilv3 [Drechslerella dactyloides]|uniref:dihydroxy-acid dehydratase n=1 Tax=Drechslerella dactyloides TaxID=74499 RepID=A0AAD6J2E9_DREDA|nr:dihydroxy-acid dehydratase ilv3 [Drechslerella dactyloides]
MSGNSSNTPFLQSPNSSYTTGKKRTFDETFVEEPKPGNQQHNRASSFSSELEMLRSILPPRPTSDKFRLVVRQQPVAARACGFGERDRRVIDPPPIVQLVAADPADPANEGGIKYPWNVVHCTLYNVAGTADETALEQQDKRLTRRLMGTLVSSPFVGQDENGKEGCFFCFPDLSCRTHGKFRLKFALMCLDPNAEPSTFTRVTTEVMSDVFTVYTAKEFPGMRPSTGLTKALKRQGCAISVKKGNEKATTQQASPQEQAAGEDENNGGEEEESEPEQETTGRVYATGLKEVDMDKAQVGISSVWYSGNPCNMHLLDLNHKVKQGVEQAGLVGYQFNTIGVSDAISMGTSGMRYSLQSRDLIADSIETVMGGQWYDANISIPGCDKNMPGVIMAFQAYGEYITGTIDEKTRFDIIRHACPGQGACGGMYTANTMATAIESMGMTLPYSSSNPADSAEKAAECLASGWAIRNLLEKDIKPRQILTRSAFENAMVVVNITGGSTNAVLHLIAIADSVGVKLTIDDFQSVSDRIPFLADLKPSGKYVMADIHRIGGTPALLKYLLEHDLIDGSILTVTGKTLAENLEKVTGFPKDQDVIRPLSNPIKPTGHIQILRGSLAPGGAVGKITGKEGLKFQGKAKVYDAEDLFIEALERGEIKKGEKTVVVIRYEGPKGGPGMPEMLKPSSAIMGAGLGNDVALITDGRFSGGSHGFLIGHIVPEAQEGGPIAFIEDGDEILIDAEQRKLDLLVDDAVLAKRKAAFVQKPLKYNKGVLYKYAKNVADASHGCITDS